MCTSVSAVRHFVKSTGYRIRSSVKPAHVLVAVCHVVVHDAQYARLAERDFRQPRQDADLRAPGGWIPYRSTRVLGDRFTRRTVFSKVLHCFILFHNTPAWLGFRPACNGPSSTFGGDVEDRPEDLLPRWVHASEVSTHRQKRLRAPAYRLLRLAREVQRSKYDPRLQLHMHAQIEESFKKQTSPMLCPPGAVANAICIRTVV